MDNHRIKEAARNAVISRWSFWDKAGICSRLTAFCILPAIILGTIMLVSIGASQAASKVIINEGDEWSYFMEKNKPHGKWKLPGYDDSTWNRGRTGFGYGNLYKRTHLDKMKGKFRRVYARRKFEVNGADEIKTIKLSVVCDGPFAVYINGLRVIRNIRGLSSGDPAVGSPVGEELDITGWAHELYTGLNVITVQCDNDDIDSDDYLFIPTLKINEE